MKKFLQKKLNQKGLTLVELLAVIVILGIIAAIAVPAIGNIINNSKVNALYADGQNALSAGKIYFSEAKSKEGADINSITIANLKAEGFLEDAGGLTDTTTIDRAKAGTETNNIQSTISGDAKNGSINVNFNKATNKNISDADTKTGGTNVTVTR